VEQKHTAYLDSIKRKIALKVKEYNSHNPEITGCIEVEKNYRKEQREKLYKVTEEKYMIKWNAINMVMNFRNKDQIRLIKFKKHPRNTFLMKEFRKFK